MTLQLAAAYGVQITSRHDHQHEIDAMTRIVGALPPGLIASIWCDSNACADYHISVAQPYASMHWLHQNIAVAIEGVIVETLGGHNGSSIIYGEGVSQEIRIDANWPFEDDDDQEAT